ncbi:glycosyl hydrolase family 95 catalytic domain-containing protein [Pedobacter gandavensis]|uniref:Alpha-L-fucosidase n=1 Tax=Pedobacter gandavensis TaxID=2679963 RepID=A0ABR6EUE3_9SPHI|nr:alpha-L-fucosidase [Pedobacter gandavensis]MBB2148894.1 alpha-L-fucosidase [Pedobacter gandavensis]
MKSYLSFFFFLLSTSVLSAQVKPAGINWPVFMKRQTLHWDTIGTSYYSGIILGNGLLGTNIYKEDAHTIRFDIGRTDVTDQREHQGAGLSEPLISKPRLPIGRMTLKTVGEITAAKMTLDIYNARAEGTIFTTKGTLKFNSFVPANTNVIYISAKGTQSEKNINWQFMPEKSKSPRMNQQNAGNPVVYPENPAYQLSKVGSFDVCKQSLLNNGGYATVWANKKHANESTMIISVGYDADGKSDELKEASQAIQTFSKSKYQTVVAAHQKWWHQFYQQSFISIPDQRMESFYWIQLYKLASATRENLPMIDLMGPWFNGKTPWPGVWWNLNTQLTYSPIFTANHLELGKPLFNTLNRNLQNLINNVPEVWRKDAAAIGRISGYDLLAPLAEANKDNGQFELGNLTWTMFYYYQYYAYSKDREELKKNIYPLLRRSVNHLLYHLKKDEHGVLHLPSSFSPEYKYAEDANYALSSLRWGLVTLISLNEKDGFQDADLDKWKNILQNLVPYPVNETGLMIGKNVSLTSSHRHYSHMLMIYPYHLLTPLDTTNKALIEQSLNHWLSLKGALQGYTFTGAASINAMMGKGDQAYDLLNQLFDQYIQPNTLYQESGPVIETPLSAATSIQELLLQSWGNKIRIFPAVPAAWKDVSFDKLRTEGGFLVSASKVKGKTEFIKVYSSKGDTCRLETDFNISLVTSDKRGGIDFSVFQNAGKVNISFSTLPGETILLSEGYPNQKFNINPVTSSIRPNWSWGLQKKRLVL